MADMAARAGSPTDPSATVPSHPARSTSDQTRDRGAGIAPYTLLAVSLAAAVALVNAVPETFSAQNAPWFVALTAVAAAVRAWGSSASPFRPGRARAAFWLGLGVTLVLVLLNPAFGLYAFIFYPDSGRLLRGLQARLALPAVAAVCALAQTGGPNSPLFTPLFVGLFLLVNLVVAGSMAVFDRQRQRTSEALAQANDRLRAAQSRNEALQEQLLEQAREAGITQERARLAREIHDTIAQDLVAIIAQLSAATQAAQTSEARRDASDKPDTHDNYDDHDVHDHDLIRRLHLAERTARDALAEARRSVRALSSPRLDHDDLPAAIRRLLDAWQEVTGADARLVTRGPGAPTGVDPIVLRVVQEALANAARHAGPRSVELTLTYTADTLQVEIADDGTGFDVSAVSAGHGIPGMRERVEQAGGEVDISSAPGRGTRVRAQVPRRRP